MRELTWKRWRVGGLAIAVFCLASVTARAQSQPEQQPKQEIPDAPSASRPAQPFPSTPPAVQPTPPVPGAASPTPAPTPAPEEEAPAPKPPLNIKTVPEGGATPATGGSQEELFKLITTVNQVLVPVMVKDDSGRLTSGLLPKDFSVYEDGVKQKMNFFTSDPFALSAAVILDLGMPDSAVQKVNQTFPALEGAFSQFDEVSIYTYSSTFAKVSDFAAAGKQVTTTLNTLKSASGRNNGPPVTSGPLGPQGPIINGVPVNSPVVPVVTPPKEAHVLNDAILAAALDLGKRDRTRRKIIFIISDGREFGSKASYSDVLKVLLTNGIIVYGVAAEGSAIPLYNKLERLHLPRFGYSNILPKYTNATGGWLYTEFSRSAIEDTYARALSDARNQYTLGYVTRATPSTAYRQIEVRVNRPGCDRAERPCVSIYAKDGYYPVPPTR
ncbi:MAG: VWA domain-containing protein [Acidobacteriia bacterium]|nr:VWA domain-containing protein [Terriglobia bacterium]